MPSLPWKTLANQEIKNNRLTAIKAFAIRSFNANVQVDNRALDEAIRNTTINSWNTETSKRWLELQARLHFPSIL